MFKPRRDLTVKIPGARGTDDEPNPDAEALEAAVDDTSDVDVQDEVSVASAPADMKAYIDAQIAKGIAAGMKSIKKAQSNPAAPHVELPDQSTVDAGAIDKPVLTKQGYVVPHGSHRIIEG